MSEKSAATSNNSNNIKPVNLPSADAGCVVIKETVAAPPSGASYGSVEIGIISPILVVIGWFVVARLQANRERRKQIREFVSDLLDRLNRLELLAIEYHTSERNVAREQEIITSLTRFETACNLILGFVSGQCIPAVKRSLLEVEAKRIQVLRKAMTLEHFADEHTVGCSHTSDIVQGISLAVFELIENLERIRIASLD